MGNIRKIIWAIALILASWWFAPTVSAEDILLDAGVYPVLQDGKLTGCQVVFTVARDDCEFNNGEQSVANGLVMLSAKSDRAALRIGVSSDLKSFRPPARASFYSNF